MLINYPKEMKIAHRNRLGRSRTRLLLTLIALSALLLSLPAPASAYFGVGSPRGAWEIECAGCPRSFISYTDHSLRLDQEGDPHVAYGSENLYYASRDGDGWVKQVVDPSFAVGGYPSLALEADGSAHISYYDAYNGDLKYARQWASGWYTYTLDAAGVTGCTLPSPWTRSATRASAISARAPETCATRTRMPLVGTSRPWPRRVSSVCIPLWRLDRAAMPISAITMQPTAAWNMPTRTSPAGIAKLSSPQIPRRDHLPGAGVRWSTPH